MRLNKQSHGKLPCFQAAACPVAVMCAPYVTVFGRRERPSASHRRVWAWSHLADSAQELIEALYMITSGHRMMAQARFKSKRALFQRLIDFSQALTAALQLMTLACRDFLSSPENNPMAPCQSVAFSQVLMAAPYVMTLADCRTPPTI